MPVSSKALQRQADVLVSLLDELSAAVSAGHPTDARLAQIFRQHREYGSRDRRLFSDAVFAFFRWRGWIEPAAGDPRERIALALAFDGHPPHPALPAVDSIAARGPIAALVPEWLARHVPTANFEELVLSFQKRPPVWLRARRGHADKLVRSLEALGVRPSIHPSIAEAISFDGSINLDLLRRHAGHVFEVQDLASQRVGLACDPMPGERWLDVCAGAGGKSLHLADLMENRGEIVATDVRASALEQLRLRARKSHVAIIRPSLVTDHRPPVTLFDGVLVDAPCSGIGTWSRSPDARWRTTEDGIAEKTALQLTLLRDAAASVKPGGKLIYSVCTVTRSETSGVIETFLSVHPHFRTSAPPHFIMPREGPCGAMFIARFVRAN